MSEERAADLEALLRRIRDNGYFIDEELEKAIDDALDGVSA